MIISDQNNNNQKDAEQTTPPKGGWGVRIILASGSPRRKELLAGLGLDFEIRLLKGIDESYPEGLSGEEIAEHISREKAEAYKATIADNELIITADTIVYLGGEEGSKSRDGQVLGKPKDDDDAKRMLRLLSGRQHQVITGVTLLTKNNERTNGNSLSEQKSQANSESLFRIHTFSSVSEVFFKTLTDDEIDYYVSHFHPTDKAGAYGIQEWIGYIGVERIEGSYFNVMGLPVQKLYTELNQFLCNKL